MIYSNKQVVAILFPEEEKTKALNDTIEAVFKWQHNEDVSDGETMITVYKNTRKFMEADKKRSRYESIIKRVIPDRNVLNCWYKDASMCIHASRDWGDMSNAPIKLKTSCNIKRMFRVFLLLAREHLGKCAVAEALESYDFDWKKYGSRKRTLRMIDKTLRKKDYIVQWSKHQLTELEDFV